MERLKMRFFVLVTLLLCSIAAQAQIIIGANAAYQIPLGATENFFGAQLLIEKPSNDRNSFVGRVSYYFPRQLTVENAYVADAIVPGISPTSINLDHLTQYSTINIEFGRRAYVINPIDYGFSLYFNSNLIAGFNLIRSRLEEYDRSQYQIYGGDVTANGKGSVFNLGLNLNGGMKYDFTFGTFFFDINFNYNFIQFATNDIARSGYQSFGSPFLFTFGLGYRKLLFLK